MFDLRFVARIILGAVIILGATIATGQDYPSKTIRIVTSAAGGGSDFSARMIAQGISGPLRQPVIVDNRGSVIAIESVAKAPPDGYTLLVAANPLWVLPHIQTVHYDPVRDFAPISSLDISPTILVVHPSVPVKSVKELIALAKAKPEQLNCSSAGSGSIQQVAMELFKSMAGVDIVHVPYSGGGANITALLGGQVDLTFASTPSAAPHMKSGRLRALAVTSAQTSALFPELPTVSASGLPGYSAEVITGIFAPTRTPQAVISRLNQEIVILLTQTEVKGKYLSVGVESGGSSPEKLAATVKSEMAKAENIFRNIGPKPK